MSQDNDSGNQLVNAISCPWEQGWVQNLFLSILFSVMLFMMMLAIYLVMMLPIPSGPESETGSHDGPALVEVQIPHADYQFKMEC